MATADDNDCNIVFISFYALRLKQSIVDKVIDRGQPRLRGRIHAKGKHFEQLLN